MHAETQQHFTLLLNMNRKNHFLAAVQNMLEFRTAYLKSVGIKNVIFLEGLLFPSNVFPKAVTETVMRDQTSLLGVGLKMFPIDAG